MPQSLHGIRVEWQSVCSRTLVRQQVPRELWLDAAHDAVAHLGRQAEADCFVALHGETARTLPAVVPWVEANPIRALALAPVWSQCPA